MDFPMDEEIKPHAVYTTGETEKLLKVSNSTVKRLLKKGLIKANKVGGQYRILGKEILRVISPKAEEKAAKLYTVIRNRIVDRVNKW